MVFMDRVFVVDGFISPRLSGYSVYLHIPSPPLGGRSSVRHFIQLVPEVFTNALGKYASPLFCICQVKSQRLSSSGDFPKLPRSQRERILILHLSLFCDG